MAGRSGRDEELVKEHSSRSEAVLRILKEDGVDVSQLRSVDVYFWCLNRAKARALADELQEGGYGGVVVGQSTTDQKWGVQASREMRPAELASEGFTKEMILLAEKHRSEYDGRGGRHR